MLRVIGSWIVILVVSTTLFFGMINRYLVGTPVAADQGTTGKDGYLCPGPNVYTTYAERLEASRHGCL